MFKVECECPVCGCSFDVDIKEEADFEYVQGSYPKNKDGTLKQLCDDCETCYTGIRSYQA